MKIKRSYLLFIVISSIFYSTFLKSEISVDQKRMIEDLPPDQRDSIIEKMTTANEMQEEIDKIFEEESTLTQKPEIDLEIPQEDRCKECIFGYDFFQFSPSTFVQTSSAPVPLDYLLGPGDKLQIEYFGSNEDSKEVYITRNGKISLPLIGPVNVAGMTYREASEFLERKVLEELIGTSISISVVELRSISIYILGEAYKPGLYTMSALSSVSNALFVSGGVNEQGSLRNIEIKRNGEVLAVYDFYDFLLKGVINKDIRLQDGDIIFIPFIENKVLIGGAFKRPHIYEFKDGETIRDAINLAGGFKSDVPPDSIIELSTINVNTFTRELINLSQDLISLDRKLANEDSLNISSRPYILAKSIKLSGEINKPGVYTFNSGDTILDVLTRAGGFTPQAYEEGAVFLRDSVAKSQKEGFDRSAEELEQTIVDIITQGTLQNASEATLSPLTKLIRRLRDTDPLGRMVVNVDLLTLKTDPIQNFKLEDGDSLFIPTRPNSVSIIGEVLNSSTQSFNPNIDSFEYINLAGGLNKNADASRIFVILPNGQSKILRRSLFSSKNEILPGSTIVVSRESRPLDGVNIAQIVTPILADLATSAAAIAAIND